MFGSNNPKGLNRMPQSTKVTYVCGKRTLVLDYCSFVRIPLVITLSVLWIDGFWLTIWYLLINPLVSSDYHFGIFWLPLWYLLITTLISSDYHFGIFWLPLWYPLITTLISSDYHFGIFKHFFRLSPVSPRVTCWNQNICS